MTELKDPQRLFEPASGAAPGLRDALSAARADVGSTGQVTRLAARLGPLLAVPVPAPPAAVPAAMGAAAKLGLGALAVLVAGGGALLLSTSQSAPPPAPTSAQPPAAQVAAPAPLPAATPAAAAFESAAAPSEPALSGKPAPPPAQLSEAELLEQARGALKGEPARALGRTNEHRRRFPGGVLVQEREVIAIQALRQLGRSAEADARTEAFSKAFPGSAFQRKLKPAP